MEERSDLLGRATLSLGEFQPNAQGWLENAANGLVHTRVPLQMFDTWMERWQNYPDHLLCFEIIPGGDRRGYVWVTRSIVPVIPGFDKFLQNFGGARLVKYTGVDGTFFITFDRVPECSDDDLVALVDGLVWLGGRDPDQARSHTFFGAAPRYSVLVRDSKAHPTDVTVLGFDRDEFFGVRFDAEFPIVLVTQDLEAIREDIDQRHADAWKRRLDFNARISLAGFTEPCDLGGVLHCTVTVRDDRTGKHQCSALAVNTEANWASGDWCNLGDDAVLDLRTWNEQPIAWVRREQTLRVVPAETIFTSK